MSSNVNIVEAGCRGYWYTQRQWPRSKAGMQKHAQVLGARRQEKGKDDGLGHQCHVGFGF